MGPCLRRGDEGGWSKAGYTCALSEANAAHHIWDLRDRHGFIGAVACVVVPAFRMTTSRPARQILARWIDDVLPYSTLEFFPTYWAFNIGWHERPKREVTSYAEPRGRWGGTLD